MGSLRPGPRSMRPVPAATPGDLYQLAEMRHRDPVAALEGAMQETAGPPPSAAVAWWVVGLARHELVDLPGAIEAFRRALDLDAAAGGTGVEARARASLAISLLGLGQVAESQREIARAEEAATELDRGFVGLLDGLVKQRTGELAAATVAYSEALPLLLQAGDLASVARLCLNRGILHAYQGDTNAALRDLSDAEKTARDLDLPVLAAMAAHNIGFALGRRGDIPNALASFIRARDTYASQGNPARLVAVLAADQCEVLLEAGLFLDACESALLAVTKLAETGDVVHLDEARLLYARACLASGDLEEAAAQARVSAKSFRRSKRLTWATLADYVALQAEVGLAEEEPRPPASLLRRTRLIADSLQAHGWPVEAAHVRTFIGRMLLSMGRPAEAKAELASMAAVRARGTASLRVHGWHAAALVRLAAGDRAGAKRAVRAGLATIERYRSTMGATELRASAGGLGSGLGRLGLRLALEDGRPAEVLRWAERARAGALRLAPVIASPEAGLADALADLRQAQAGLQETILAGHPDPAAEHRVATAERRVQQLSRTVRADPAAASLALEPARLRASLGGRALIEYVSVDGELYAVMVTSGRSKLVPLGSEGPVAEERSHLLSALRRGATVRRRARGRGSGEEQPGDRGVVASAARLDELLIAPLGLDPAAPLVVVPTGAGHGLPWSLLPSLRGRPLTVAPSASLWLRHPARSPGQPPVLIAGPGLPGALAEVQALTEHWPDARVLVGGDATVEATLAACEGASLLHLAAHGTFRADSPLFSSLQMADGLLTVYDLERLRTPPAVAVLPACSAAQLDVRPGDELLGTAAVLLNLGVRSVIAPVVPVADQPTARFSVALHASLAQGDPPSVALASAIDAIRTCGDHATSLAAMSFVCIGANEGELSTPTSSGDRAP